jgi:hypothetical protein
MALQALHIAHTWPTLKRSGGAHASVWRGQLLPSPTAPWYTILLSYTLGHTPRVRVEKPKLKSGAPHLYRDGSLCLYYPPDWRWHSGRLLADTIIPWAASWLYFYELWLDTDVWLGPSAPHNPDGKQR